MAPAFHRRYASADFRGWLFYSNAIGSGYFIDNNNSIV
jgi:hypothetical protein